MHWNNSEGGSEDNIDMVVDEDEVMCVDWSSLCIINDRKFFGTGCPHSYFWKFC